MPWQPSLMQQYNETNKVSPIQAILVFVWLSFALGGFLLLGHYDSAPGTAEVAPSKFPTLSGIEIASDGPTLIMFLHPYCPCSRASVSELESILALTANFPKTYILFIEPKGAKPGWSQSDLFVQASKVSGVIVKTDREGKIASLFGAKTSGHCLLYSASEDLLFSGGITESRGHAGDNPAKDALIKQIRQPDSALRKTLVFGCALGSK